jgi:hypothetical protein
MRSWLSGVLSALVLVGCIETRPAARPAPEPTVVAAPTAGPIELDANAIDFGNVVRLESARLLTSEVHEGERVAL